MSEFFYKEIRWRNVSVVLVIGEERQRKEENSH